MGVAYSQTRNIARVRVARADVSEQVSELFTADDSRSVEDTFYPERVTDKAAAWAEALDDDAWFEDRREDRRFFELNGYWRDWGFEKWLEKEMEREACAEWEAAQSYPALGPDE